MVPRNHASLPLPAGKMPCASASPGGPAAADAAVKGEVAAGDADSAAMATEGEGAEEEESVLSVVRIVRALGAVVNKKGDGKDADSESNPWKESEDAAHAIGMLALSLPFRQDLESPANTTTETGRA